MSYSLAVQVGDCLRNASGDGAYLTQIQKSTNVVFQVLLEISPLTELEDKVVMVRGF
jgi:hypothetical protein